MFVRIEATVGRFRKKKKRGADIYGHIADEPIAVDKSPTGSDLNEYPLHS